MIRALQRDSIMFSIQPDTVFTKTAKGLVELDGKRTLPAELNVIFLAVDGRATVADLLTRFGLSADELHRSLETLVHDGYIEHAQRRAEQGIPSDERTALDFTAGRLEDADAGAAAPEPALDTAERERAREHASTALERAMAKFARETPQSRARADDAKVEHASPEARPQQKIEPALERAARLEASLGERVRQESRLDNPTRLAEAAELRRAADSAHRARAQENAHRQKNLARANRRKLLRWGLVLIFAGIPLAAVVSLQFVPLDRYRARAETALSIRLGEPVKVGAVRYVLFPTPRIILEKLTLARRSGISAERLEVPVLPWAALRGLMHVQLAKLSGLELDGPALAGIADWTGARSGAAVELDRLQLERTRLTLPQTELAPFDGDIEFDTDGSVKEAVLTNPKVIVELTALPKGVRVLVTARDWRIPYGPPVEFSDLTIRGHLEGRNRGIAEFTGKAAGGVVDGVVNADWGTDVLVEGHFRVENARIHDLAPAFTSSFAPRGILQVNGRFDMKAPALPALRASSRVDATFSLARGEITNIDLVRAIQSPGKGALRGGRTTFEKLTGVVQSARGQYTYRDLTLVSGPLNASGSVSVKPDGDLSGRIRAELASKGGVVARSALTLGGTIEDPRLRR
jgi:hypothetical protein